jgi:hypothetical protein
MPQVPPSLAQCLQALHVRQAKHGVEPMHVDPNAVPANIRMLAMRRILFMTQIMPDGRWKKQILICARRRLIKQLGFPTRSFANVDLIPHHLSEPWRAANPYALSCRTNRAWQISDAK